MSPFIFNLAAEVLSKMVMKAMQSRYWKGVEIKDGGVQITHLQFADDTLFFCPGDIKQLLNIKKVLMLFHLISGLTVNFHKSYVYGVNVNKEVLKDWVADLKCQVGELPSKYLGLPLGGKCHRLGLWDPVLQKMEQKLAAWKGKVLSTGGRVTLVKSALANLPLYYMSLFPLPKGVAAKIIKLQRVSVGAERRGEEDVVPGKLEIDRIPKKMGDLNVGNILHNMKTPYNFGCSCCNCW